MFVFALQVIAIFSLFFLNTFVHLNLPWSFQVFLILTYEIFCFLLLNQTSISVRLLQYNLIYTQPLNVCGAGLPCNWKYKHGLIISVCLIAVWLRACWRRETGSCLFYDIWSPEVKFWIVLILLRASAPVKVRKENGIRLMCSLLHWTSGYIR